MSGWTTLNRRERKKMRANWEIGDELFKNVCEPLKNIIRNCEATHPEIVQQLSEAQEIIWEMSNRLTEDDEDIKQAYLGEDNYMWDGANPYGRG